MARNKKNAFHTFGAIRLSSPGLPQTMHNFKNEKKRTTAEWETTVSNFLSRVYQLILLHCTVPTLIRESFSRRITVPVTVATDGNKLPFFCVFEGKARCYIQSSLDPTSPAVVVWPVREKVWMESKMMSISYEKVWNPYVTQYTGQSILLLDDYKCHKATQLADWLNEFNTVKTMIPHIILQLCNRAMLEWISRWRIVSTNVWR